MVNNMEYNPAKWLVITALLLFAYLLFGQADASAPASASQNPPYTTELSPLQGFMLDKHFPSVLRSFIVDVECEGFNPAERAEYLFVLDLLRNKHNVPMTEAIVILATASENFAQMIDSSDNRSQVCHALKYN